jgi:hypothetical protein
MPGFFDATSGRNKSVLRGEKLVLLPSADGVPFELVTGGRNHEKCTYLHGDQTACSREFATYNLMTITALFDRSHRRIAQDAEGKIVFQPYPSGGRMVKASGNVVDKDEHGGYRRNSARFFIGDGHAVPVY